VARTGRQKLCVIADLDETFPITPREVLWEKRRRPGSVKAAQSD
jgi:hypothetical protein